MPSPRELFTLMGREWTSNAVPIGAHLAEDVVIEMPFARPNQPRRIEGRDVVLSFARAGRTGLPVRFEICRELTVHETADPAVIVVEYELGGTILTTGQFASAPFIGVLEARDGKVGRWREYQNTRAIDEALATVA
jgi:ketosteroid isomerase-like protein